MEVTSGPRGLSVQLFSQLNAESIFTSSHPLHIIVSTFGQFCFALLIFSIGPETTI